MEFADAAKTRAVWKMQPRPEWGPGSPHRLRKNAATEVRKIAGVEMAKTILGQHSIAVTELYAERDEQRAAEIIRQIG